MATIQKRNKNFSDGESDELIKLVNEHSAQLNSKQKQAIEAGWREIHLKFKVKFEKGPERDVAQLKMKFKNIRSGGMTGNVVARPKSEAYTKAEEKILSNLISIADIKFTSSRNKETLLEEQKKWEQVTEMFCNTPGVVVRAAKSLRKKGIQLRIAAKKSPEV